MKKILLVLFLLPLSLLAQLRDSVYVKTDIFTTVYSEVLQQPKWVTYTVQCSNGRHLVQGWIFTQMIQLKPQTMLIM